MSKTYHCAHCCQQFTNITDHMSHVVREHDTGFVPRQSGRRLMRSTACSSCASEIMPTDTHCRCGAPRPVGRHHD